MTPYLADQDLTLYVGDALEVLRGLPDGSVDCCVTSPPYWGLRDYGTGEWEGGNVTGCPIHDLTYFHGDQKRHNEANYPLCSMCCDHRRPRSRRDGAGRPRPDLPNPPASWAERDARVTKAHDECECGARRVDRQIGLEATPDLFVAKMVEVFREVRRVLAAHGTCWVNLGDSYAASMTSDRHMFMPSRSDGSMSTRDGGQIPGMRTAVGGLKPKDLVGVPWRVAFALQADGWWLRSDIIWAKPNPMPESVTDRPTKAHEYVFLLTKQPRYWFDAEAVREPAEYGFSNGKGDRWRGVGSPERAPQRGGYSVTPGDGTGGRNVRSVWEIATQPYPEAHFATFPEELPRRAIAAGCPLAVCRVCGKPRERMTDVSYEEAGRNNNSLKTKGGGDAAAAMSARPYETRKLKHTETLGWSDCGCEGCGCDYETAPTGDRRWFHAPDCRGSKWRPGVVLDPFAGAGTTLLVARKLGRSSIGIELNPEYAELIARRTRQLSLLAEQTA